jgi:conjugal transfer ATP-binding protein TraC
MAKSSPAARTQDLVDIQDIKNGVVVLKDGSLRKIILVDGINFDLKSTEEQGLIIGAYQSLLNALDFSVQINIHSRKLNIDGYIENLTQRLESETHELLKIQLEEYIEFIKSFVQTNAIMTKSFSVVVPYNPLGSLVPGKKILSGLFGKKTKDNKTAETRNGAILNPAHLEQLQQRVDEVISNLRQIGLRAVALEDDELVELFYNFYNPSAVEKRGAAIAKQRTGGVAKIEDVVAPAAIEVGPNHLKLGDWYAKTLFVFTYPRYLSVGWLSPIINLPNFVDISIFIHPSDTGVVLRNLRKKAAQIESEINQSYEKGMVRNPTLETALKDVEELRDSLVQTEEKLFDVSIYFTIYADSEEELTKLATEIVDNLDNKLVNVKPANFEQLQGFQSTMPLGQDKLGVHTPLNSSPISSMFPFVSLELTSDEGIMYGINRHNNTLIIFDRFTLENANTVVFGKAGSGKSYATKLEIIRSLMLGADIIVIDPENEYETLTEAVGGSLFKISLDSESNINPFDVPFVAEGDDFSETLKSHIVNLAGLLKLMLGGASAEEEAILDQAITETYASRDITPESGAEGKHPPLLQDLESVLENIDGGKDMAKRLYRFTKGSYAGFTNKPSNLEINNRLVVFSIRDLEESLRPIAMYVILNYIWGLIRRELKRRIMVVDEAWLMMKYEDSASFLYRLAKRARKYYLGITTITQDVEDFLSSSYGKPIITNSSLQLLLKQSTAAIDLIGKAFNLTDVEKNYLIEIGVGEGLFIAGLKHAAIQIVPSYFEDKLITTDPKELLGEE